MTHCETLDFGISDDALLQVLNLFIVLAIDGNAEFFLQVCQLLLGSSPVDLIPHLLKKLVREFDAHNVTSNEIGQWSEPKMSFMCENETTSSMSSSETRK